MENKYLKGISINVFYIGLLSFFGGISQDIFSPIFPLYLTFVLNKDKSFIGIASGLVLAAASIFKMISGFLADKFNKKPIIFSGYFLSMIGRLLLPVFTSGTAILGLRGLDGIGKGVKDSPKDALIANSTKSDDRGKNFGAGRALDTLGSVVGPLILAGLLLIFKNSYQKYHYILYFSAIPLLFTLLILVFKVKEAQNPPKEIKKDGFNNNDKKYIKLPISFYVFLAIALIFALGNSSDAFLILRANNLGVGLLGIPLIYALFNFVYASASIPLGSLSDKIGREKVIIVGWIAFSLSYLGFAIANHAWQVWIVYAFFGLYYATTEGVAKAYIADMVDTNSRGKAYGIYNATVGLAALPAGAIAGLLWDKVNPSASFFFGTAISVFAILLFIIFVKIHTKK